MVYLYLNVILNIPSNSLLKGVEGSLRLEIEDNFLGGQSLVDVGDDVDLVLKELLLSLVKGDLHNLRTVSSVSDSSGDDGAGKDEVIEDGVVDGSQSSASGSLLGFMDLEPLRLDGSLGDEDNLSLNLRLNISDDLLVDSLQEDQAGEGDGDQKDLSALLSLGGGLDLLNTSDVDVLQSALQFGGRVFEVVESLSNGELVSVGLLRAGLVELVSVVLGHFFLWILYIIYVK